MTILSQTLNQQDQEYFSNHDETDLLEKHEALANSAPIQENDHNTDRSEQTNITQKASNFSRSVPHGALHAEREEHKKTRTALAQLRAQYTQALAQLGTRHEQESTKEQGETQQQTKDNIPNPAEDFLGFIRWQGQQQQQDGGSQLWQIWQQSREASKSELPDFDQALGFLAQMREQQLSALGQIDGRFQDEQNRAQQMQNELRDLISVSVAKGENPAKMIYQLARAYGYNVGDVSARLKGLDEAQKAARTLTASNGSSAGDPMLIETLANLSESDFARWYEANPDSFRRLFAG